MRNSSLIPSLRIHLLDGENIEEKIRSAGIDPIVLEIKDGNIGLNITEAKKYFDVIMIQKKKGVYQIDEF